MSFRFRRQLRLIPGVHLNLSRSGVSTTIGVPGLRVTMGKRPAVNVGIPGSGLSYRESLSDAASHAPAPTPGRHVHIPWLWLSPVALIVLWVIFRAYASI
jgi:hypothetical protein